MMLVLLAPAELGYRRQYRYRPDAHAYADVDHAGSAILVFDARSIGGAGATPFANSFNDAANVIARARCASATWLSLIEIPDGIVCRRRPELSAERRSRNTPPGACCSPRGFGGLNSRRTVLIDRVSKNPPGRLANKFHHLTFC
jgi:hypothetical protein